MHLRVHLSSPALPASSFPRRGEKAHPRGSRFLLFSPPPPLPENLRIIRSYLIERRIDSSSSPASCRIMSRILFSVPVDVDADADAFGAMAIERFRGRPDDSVFPFFAIVVSRLSCICTISVRFLIPHHLVTSWCCGYLHREFYSAECCQ